LEIRAENILVIDFGQIGDVILSLPALAAIRRKFPDSKITVLVGAAGGELISIAGVADFVETVDRTGIRDGSKLAAPGKILSIIRKIRRRHFDFVIDLRSFYETNLLGFVSGAKHRLFANRDRRSLDFLSNFRPAPPLEDRSQHLTDYYLRVLTPLGIDLSSREATIVPRALDLEIVDRLLPVGKPIVGLFPGAGHPSRRWQLEKFAALARSVAEDDKCVSVVFLGPEEAVLRPEIEAKFPHRTTIVDKLSLPQFAAALSRVKVLVSNDTGAAHVGAVVGAHIVLILDERAPLTYLPLTRKLTIIQGGPLETIAVENVLYAARQVLEAPENFG
jgi:ADP-heptose:LPS heptosyltransferase